MDDRAQVSTEYLIILAVSLVLAAVVTLLTVNLFSVKSSVKELIEIYYKRALQLVT
ncbi:hypothetical protein DRN74_01660 [Candidatus Micrarchaeota archaeon]|nr:MAG: hypothetical protein DRN74_01660 [Candidatus Micrarchaeota archaeon]